MALANQVLAQIDRFNTWLKAPEDGAGLAAFRISFGLAMAWDAARFLNKGWVASHYIEPDFLFKYPGFEWVTPLPEPGMTAVYVGMIISSLLIALGAFYRAAITYYFVAHTYTFLLAAEHYLNHHYLISLVAFLLLWMPANRCLSIDAWGRDDMRALATPRWCRFTLEAQLAIVYMFGAVAKLNSDWLNGVPIAQWLQNSADRNPWGAELIGSPAMVPVVLWGGILFDFLIVPALLWRPTRALAVGASVAFHLTNATLFDIGVFPWMMVGATTLFFEPDWPRRVPGLRSLVSGWVAPMTPPPSPIRAVWVPVCLWLAVQIAMPLRHHLYPGDVAWTEEGHNYSWRMKLRSKRGKVSFRVRDPQTNEEWRIYPAHELNGRQLRKMAGKPELILQYAHHLADVEREHLGRPVEVRADAFVSLNYRKPQRLIDPDRDLAAERASLRPYDWILPFTRTKVRLEEPHPRQRD